MNAAMQYETEKILAERFPTGSATSSSRPGDIFHIAPGHDSWVVGEEPYVSLHFFGADHYADRS
jgi:hypothetical protein